MRNSRILFFISIVTAVVLVPLLPTIAPISEPIASAEQAPLVDFSALSIITLEEIDAATSTATSTSGTMAISTQTPQAAPLSQQLRGNPSEPVRLIIPSIGLDDAVNGVGIDQEGDMAVPSGKTSTVGWYEYGTVPGQIGSAVLDAHVFAAFSQLKDLSTGGDIYVQMGDGSMLHFVVQETDTYPLADVPVQRLFNGAGAARLNLITCAGNLIDNDTTYDHRLVVYAVLES